MLVVTFASILRKKIFGSLNEAIADFILFFSIQSTVYCACITKIISIQAAMRKIHFESFEAFESDLLTISANAKNYLSCGGGRIRAKTLLFHLYKTRKT